MFKIAAFIEFNKKINSKILTQKRMVKKKFGNQIYLNHPVHLTLFTLSIKKVSELRKIYKNEGKCSQPISINITKSGIFFNDPITNGHTLYYYIKKTKKISDIQLKHLKKINKNIKVFKNNNNFKIAELKKNYKNYGFPFCGKIWIPHTTIASISNVKDDNNFFKKFLTKKINLKCEINEIKFYKINKDKHDFIFSIKDY